MLLWPRDAKRYIKCDVSVRRVFTGHASCRYHWVGARAFQRLRLKLVARRVLALAAEGEAATGLEEANSLVGGVRSCSLTEALDDGVERELSDELLMLACLVGCSGTVAPRAGFFDTGSSTALGSGRACFLPTATGADAMGEGAAALNNAGEVV